MDTYYKYFLLESDLEVELYKDPCGGLSFTT